MAHAALESLEPECFWCGRSINLATALYFSIENGAAPQAPIHVECINGKNSNEVALAYHRYIGDVANAARVSFLPHIKSNIEDLLGRPTRAA